MMNDMMPTIEEIATPDILAQIEHEEWERGNEERERWANVSDENGEPITDLIMSKEDWVAFELDQAEFAAEEENAFKCDEDE